jgi:hypothetical protein
MLVGETPLTTLVSPESLPGKGLEDDLPLQVQGIVSEYERAKIMGRSRRGKKHTAWRGSLNFMSNAPFGYCYISVHDGGGEARIEIIPEQAAPAKSTATPSGNCGLSKNAHDSPGQGVGVNENVEHVAILAGRLVAGDRLRIFSDLRDDGETGTSNCRVQRNWELRIQRFRWRARKIGL